jgi:hypothetical protein
MNERLSTFLVNGTFTNGVNGSSKIEHNGIRRDPDTEVEHAKLDSLTLRTSGHL